MEEDVYGPIQLSRSPHSHPNNPLSRGLHKRRYRRKRLDLNFLPARSSGTNFPMIQKYPWLHYKTSHPRSIPQSVFLLDLMPSRFSIYPLTPPSGRPDLEWWLRQRIKGNTGCHFFDLDLTSIDWDTPPRSVRNRERHTRVVVPAEWFTPAKAHIVLEEGGRC